MLLQSLFERWENNERRKEKEKRKQRLCHLELVPWEDSGEPWRAQPKEMLRVSPGSANFQVADFTK